MKKLIELSPFIVVAIIAAILLGIVAAGGFDAPEKTTITTSTLTEVIKTAKLTPAKYIQHGIAKAQIEGKEQGFVLYYAIVKPNIEMEDIQYTIDDVEKKVTVTLPEKYNFEVELLEDKDHKYYYYPENMDDWTGKDVAFICKTDAIQKAKENSDLMEKSRKSLELTITGLLNPILKAKDYTLEIN